MNSETSTAHGEMSAARHGSGRAASANQAFTAAAIDSARASRGGIRSA
ncbi:hypothetical protein ACFPPE_09380 [Agromyces tardus]